MTDYNYRHGDKVFFKVVFGMSHIPLEKDEAEKLAKALAEGKEGIMVFRMGMIDLAKVAGIMPDFDRMEDWNINHEKIELPDVGKMLLAETPQDTESLRVGKMTPIKRLLP